MDLRAIITDLAERADEFLADASDRRQGRAGIEEQLTLEYPRLDAASRREVVDGVMGILESEDFFGLEFVGDSFADDPNEGEE